MDATNMDVFQIKVLDALTEFALAENHRTRNFLYITTRI